MSTNNGIVAICLATYNGEKYLSEQIESIVDQSFQNWVLYIKDDGSSDGTLDIIKSYAIKYPKKIINLSNISGGGNSKNNFFSILGWVSDNTHADYFMFSDQDDVWLHDKIQTSIDAMNGEQGPALVHTDLKVVDQSLETITDSFASYSHLRSDCSDLSHLLVQNNVTGCTMFWNKKLNNLIKFDKDAIMHDWWIALIASAFGVIKYVNKPTIMYRQHGHNVVGAHRVGSVGYIRDKFSDLQSIQGGIRGTYTQATSFGKQYGNKLSWVGNQILSRYIELPKFNKMKRIYTIFKFKFLKQSALQIVGQIIFI